MGNFCFDSVKNGRDYISDSEIMSHCHGRDNGSVKCVKCPISATILSPLDLELVQISGSSTSSLSTIPNIKSIDLVCRV